MTAPQQPSVGRTVHFLANAAPPCVAAIVTHVNDDGTVALTVFPPPYMGHLASPPQLAVRQDEDHADHANPTWHWPERV